MKKIDIIKIKYKQSNAKYSSAEDECINRLTLGPIAPIHGRGNV